MRLRAGWAVRGKPPGSYHDYEIIGHGGADFTAADYADVLRHYALGTPPPERTGPAALPWITVSEVRGPDGAARIGLAIEDWTGHSDAAGRPVAETRYLCVPYEQLSRAPTSYTDLCHRLSALEPVPDAGELVLEAPPFDVGRHAAAVSRIGPGRVAAAAALLLDGPVTVTGALDLSVAQRLEFLDAVAALLPFGWRTRLSMATWDQSGNRNVSLAFARQVRPRTTELDWREPRLPPPGTEGARYAEMLSELFGARGRSPAEVVAHLARQSESCASAAPADAVRVLGTLDWPVTVLHGVERGEPDLDEVRELLRGGRFRELPPDGRRKVLGALIRAGVTDDVPLLRACWAGAAGTAATPWRELRSTVRRLLWGEDAVAELDRYVELAGDHGRADELLAVLAAAIRRGEHDDGAERAGRLVLSLVDPDRPDWPATLDVLGTSPAVTCALLTCVAGLSRRRSWLAVLARHQPAALLGPFAGVLGDSGRPVAAERFGELAAHDPACVPALLTAAYRAGRPGLVLPGLAAWLTAQDRLAFRPRTALGDRLTRLRPVSPRNAGELDGLLLWLGLPPHHLPGSAGLPEYLAGFLPLWRRAMPEGRTDRRGETLASWVRQAAWAGSEESALPVLLLVRELTAGLPGEGYGLARALIAARAHAPGLEHLRPYRDWRRWAAETCPKLDEETTMTVLAELAPDASPDQVGRLCAGELARGVPGDHVAAVLLRSRLRLDGNTLVKILHETRYWLSEFGSADPGRGTVEFTASLMRVGDPDVRRTLRERTAVTAAAEIEHWLSMIGVTADSDGEILLAEDSRARLRDIADWAQQLAKPSGRGMLGRMRKS
ncbi:hypothetical protein [Actinomadura sp. GTD37]|uniref:hypothetical protein n=1 Tax=Actinomadura sp. GTD37 TaxID=1778030 RepID=UPI0035BF164F